jgi:phosphoenolpyruvate synthase/pyruvate phosphate dikinase
MNAYQKLDTAVRILVGKDEPLTERVNTAVEEVLQIIPETDMPPDLRSEYDQLLEMIKSYREDKKPEWTSSQIAIAILVIFKRLLTETGFSS